MNKQNFIDKFFAAFVVLAIVKIITLLVQFFTEDFWTVLGGILVFIVIAIVMGLVISFLAGREGNGSLFGNRGIGGRSFYVDDVLFDKIRNKYEELAEKYINEKDYRKAAKVYMNLLQDNYRGAKTLEDGELYNEAAVIYLSKLKNKSEAASCFEKGKQYKKAIDLYKELEQKEKVGDLYREIHDVTNSNLYYQMVIDDYVKNNQMVKGSLIYRKKMDKPEAAQKILLQGWEANQDAFNCLNNYFANIIEVETLDRRIKELYVETPFEKKNTFLEAMKHEFKKDPKLRDTTRNIAYEIIADKVSTGSYIVNELKHFNPEDEVILKDISRYKTGKNKMFRN